MAVSGIRRSVAAMVMVLAVAGCSVWDLGPQPDAYVGASRGAGAKRLTDAGLEAVSVEADRAGAAGEATGAVVPATMPGVGLIPSTMPAATQPSTPTTQSSQRGEVPANLTVQEAILVGLTNNAGLRVQRYNVPIARTGEERALSQFDPTVSGSVQGGRTGSSRGNTTDTVTGQIGVTEFLPTGTTVNASVSSTNAFYSDASSNFGGNLSVSQALLRGAGLEVNLASLRSAELSTKISQYELRGVAEALVANIEQTYWDLAYAERQLVIVQNALDVAQQQLVDTRERVRLGRLGESELPAAEAEMASRQENLINAKSVLEQTRMRFLRLITPAPQQFWGKTITLETMPIIPVGVMDPVDSHVDVAMRLRPELNQTKLRMQQGDLEIVQTKNGLLPRLDLFVTLGKSGLASTFGESIENVNGPDYQALIGVRGDWSPINRGAQASYRASVLSRDQVEESYNNLVHTVQLDVRSQYVEVERTRQQIDATRATRIAREANFKVQQGKLAAGSGTSLLVAIAQRDLLAAQLGEVNAVTGHLKALVELYRLEGSLLYRRGLEAPGGTPVEGIAWRK